MGRLVRVYLSRHKRLKSKRRLAGLERRNLADPLPVRDV